MNYLINTDKMIVVGKHEDLEVIEAYADEQVYNFDVVDEMIGFSKTYTPVELRQLAANLEITNITSFERASVDQINAILFKRMSQDDILEINSEDHTMAATKKKTTTRKPAGEKAPLAKTSSKTAATSGRKPALAGSQKVGRGATPPGRDGTVFHAIYQACSKQQTVEALIEGMILSSYTPPRASDPADAKYLRGYIVAMVNNGMLKKV